ncbi:site-specific integrase [Natrinema salinisoli]|uniref:site-specific integrase n=1 Tax=Natrinema salinisoli TaxID=2878535 RepID=UPI001CF07512|nr:site-specific integrase [Natrinema salinisoli]
MRMKPHPEDPGYRVWLSDDEVEQLIETMHDRGGTTHRIAGRYGVHCGLRRDEASQSRPVDVVESHDDTVLRVWEDQAKRDKYRETPIPRDLADQIRMVPEFTDLDVDDATLDVTGKTLNRWVKRAGEELAAETGDEGWLRVTYHDLRRTWGTRMLEAGVLPSVVMWHGGWDDWETFRKHYLGEFSPDALARERNKVEWLGGDGPATSDDVESHVTTAAPPTGTASYQTD